MNALTLIENHKPPSKLSPFIRLSVHPSILYPSIHLSIHSSNQVENQNHHQNHLLMPTLPAYTHLHQSTSPHLTSPHSSQSVSQSIISQIIQSNLINSFIQTPSLIQTNSQNSTLKSRIQNRSRIEFPFLIH